MINRSKTYLLPLIFDMLGLDKSLLRYVENTYMYDAFDKFKDCLILEVHYPLNHPTFKKHENSLMESELFVKHVDFNEKVFYICKFPPIYMSEYNSFKDSKYSTFSEEAKTKILKFWSEIHATGGVRLNFITNLKNILYKSEQLRKQYEKDLKVTISPEQELGQYVDPVEETVIILNNNDED